MFWISGALFACGLWRFHDGESGKASVDLVLSAVNLLMAFGFVAVGR